MEWSFVDKLWAKMKPTTFIKGQKLFVEGGFGLEKLGEFDWKKVFGPGDWLWTFLGGYKQIKEGLGWLSFWR